MDKLNKTLKSNRLYSLDYLRGFAALGIMIYHLLTWSYGKFTSDSFIGRYGVYGVGIFYILSGLTLFYVYNKRFEPTKKNFILFFKKRIFRIFPLLWLITISSIILSRKIPNFFDLFLNLTGIFGFIKWDTYFSSGIWSIGNELVFYVFFPIFLFLIKKYITWFRIFAFLITVLYFYFAFYLLDSSVPLKDQWRIYTNPLNQVFLFLSGFFLGYILKERTINKGFKLVLFFSGLIIFTYYPSSGDTINIVTGVERLVFSICCISICASLYKTELRFPKLINKSLIFLSDISYSIYLIHPIVFTVVSYTIKKHINLELTHENITIILITAIITIITSYIVYEKYEKYFIRLGKSYNNKK